MVTQNPLYSCQHLISWISLSSFQALTHSFSFAVPVIYSELVKHQIVPPPSYSFYFTYDCYFHSLSCHSEISLFLFNSLFSICIFLFSSLIQGHLDISLLEVFITYILVHIHLKGIFPYAITVSQINSHICKHKWMDITNPALFSITLNAAGFLLHIWISKDSISRNNDWNCLASEMR